MVPIFRIHVSAVSNPVDFRESVSSNQSTSISDFKLVQVIGGIVCDHVVVSVQRTGFASIYILAGYVNICTY